MKKFKFVYMAFLPFDYEYIEKKLTSLAAEGYELETVGIAFWKFRKCSPSQKRFEVLYDESASEWESSAEKDNNELVLFCAEAGWKQIAVLNGLRIFSSDDPDAVPVSTDDELRLKGNLKSMNHMFIPLRLLFVIMFAVIFMHSSVSGELPGILDIIGNLHYMTLAVFAAAILITLISDLICYSVWFATAKRNLSRGRRIPGFKVLRTISVTTNTIVVALFFTNIICCLVEGRIFMALADLAAFAGFISALALGRKITDYGRKNNLSSRKIRTSCFAVTLILMVSFMNLPGIARLTGIADVSHGRAIGMPWLYSAYGTVTHNDIPVSYSFYFPKDNDIYRYCLKNKLPQYKDGSYTKSSEKWNADVAYQFVPDPSVHRVYSNMDALLRSDAHKYLLLKDGAIVQIETLFEIKNKEMLLQSIMEKEAALSGISGRRPGSSS